MNTENDRAGLVISFGLNEADRRMGLESENRRKTALETVILEFDQIIFALSRQITRIPRENLGLCQKMLAHLRTIKEGAEIAKSGSVCNEVAIAILGNQKAKAHALSATLPPLPQKS